MRFFFFVTVLALVAMAPRSALAEDDEWAEYHAPKPALGAVNAFRAYGMGDGAADQLVVAATLSAFPLRGAEFGGFVEGAATIATTCGGCRATTARLGAFARWHLAPSSPVDTWIGLSLSYGLAHATGESDVYASETWLDAMGAIELGLDFRASSTLRIGPFASAGGSGFELPTDGKEGAPSWAGQALKLTAGARVVF